MTGAVRTPAALGGAAVALLACSAADPSPPPFEVPIVLPSRGSDGRAPDASVSSPAPAQSVVVSPTPPGAPPPPLVDLCTVPAGPVSVTIDGVAMAIEGQTLWAPNPTDPREYDLFVRFNGPGVPSGTDIIVSARRTGGGCDPYVNMLAYRPAGGAQAMPDDGATCGLWVCTLPTQPGAHLRGVFDGKLSTSTSPPSVRTVRLVFDAVR